MAEETKNSENIYKKLLSIEDANKLQAEVYSLSYEERIDLISNANFLGNILLQHFVSKGIKIFTIDECENDIMTIYELIYNLKDIDGLDISLATNISPKSILDIPEDYQVRNFVNNKRVILSGIERVTITKTSNANKIIEKKGIKGLLYNGTFTLSDEVAEYILKNYKLHRDTRLRIIKNLKTDEYIKKYLKTTILNREIRDRLISKLSDESLKEFIHFPSANFIARVTSLSDDRLKNEYLSKYKLLLTKFQKQKIVYSFNSTNYLNKYMYLFKTEYEKANLIINSCAARENNKFIRNIYLSINNEHLLYKIHIERGIFENDFFKKIKNKKYIEKCFLEGYPSYPEHFYKIASENSLKRYIKSNPEGVQNPLAFAYIKDINFIIKYIGHTQFSCDYLEEFYPLIEMLAGYYNINKDHLVKLLKVTGCELLSMLENKNIQNALNLDEDSFNKYIGLFNSEHKEASQSSISSMLNAVYSREFKIKFPGLDYLFTNTIHDVLNGNIEMAIRRINAVLKYTNTNNLTPEIIIEAIKNHNNDVVNEYKKACNTLKISKRNEYVKKCINLNMREFVTEKYEINSLIKELFNTVPADMLETIIINLANNAQISSPILQNRDLLRSLINYKKNKSYEIPAEYKVYLKDFSILLKELLNNNPIIYVPEGNKDNVQKQLESKAPKKDKLIQIIANIDPAVVKDTVLSNENVYKELIKYIETYRPLSWVETYGSKLSKQGFDFYEDSISALINYFELFLNEKKTKIESGKKVTLAEELDMIDELASDANVYSYILGDEDYKLIRRNSSPNSSPMKREDRLNAALELIKQMHGRDEICVPTINKNFQLENGKSINIMIGNTNDPINLTYGERTGACMRIGGAGEALFDYCLLNTNGFHISFNNPQTGKLVSRVSCYRNGNTVFLNEVRYSLDKSYTNKDIIEATKLIGQEIINLTANSKYPVENIITSTNYAFGNYDDEVIKLPCEPTKGITPSIYTDIYKNNAILVATSSKSSPSFKLNPKNTEIYPVGRAKIKKYTGKHARYAVGHIEVLDKYLSGTPIEEIKCEYDDYILCFAGEDWYVAIDEKFNVSTYVQQNSKNKNEATQEMNKYLNMVNDIVKEHIKDLESDGEQLDLYLENVNYEEYEKEGSERHAK